MKEKIAFSCFSHFLVKIATFLKFCSPTAQKNIFLKKKKILAKFCHIETRYTKFQGNQARNGHFIDIQSRHRDPKFKPPGAISPYVLIQNTENTKMAAKSQKINIFRSNKKQSSLFLLWQFIFDKIYGLYCLFGSFLQIFITKKPKITLFWNFSPKTKIFWILSRGVAKKKANFNFFCFLKMLWYIYHT